MLKRFSENIKRLGLEKSKPVILAVSGGVDSMVLLDLFVKSGFLPVVAHVNFSMRGSESDADQQLVETVAKNYKLKVFVRKFDTLKECERRKTGVQETARNLRYEWFEQLSQKLKIDFIATAHHSDDQIETFFINLVRGSGLQGLSGMPEHNGKIIRPLLFAGRTDIKKYALKHRIDFRNDSSNNDTKYLRNKIRHKLLPVLRTVRPGAMKKTQESIAILGEYYSFFSQQMEVQMKEICSIRNGIIKIDSKKLYLSQHAHLLLFSILQPLGFSGDNIKKLSESKVLQTGKQFVSDSHVLQVSKDFFVVRLKEIVSEEVVEIAGAGLYRLGNMALKCSVCKKLQTKNLKDPNTVYIDSSVINFPVMLRNWKKGDKMKSFGMKGTQKISDILTNAGISGQEKASAPVLEMNNEIIWLCGVRSSELLRVEEWSSKIWKIEIKKENNE